ncbi:MAG: hypothetical protein KKA61_02650 [Nanoarchaeota archaeon]|nr:hypothetical protein [Nanoarchaeota archaeon]MBU4493246.1 hypothetical protein [Nanoarchaeota archaeon]
MNHYRKRTIRTLVVLLLVFVAVFFVSYAQFKKGTLIFDLGMPNGIENLIVMFFSIAAIVKVVFEINRIESHKVFEQRMKLKA